MEHGLPPDSPILMSHSGLSVHPALIIDRAERNRLLIFDPSSVRLIRPFLRHSEIRPWHCAPIRYWAIAIPPGYTSDRSAFATRHPALGAYLQAVTDDRADWWISAEPDLPPGPQIVQTPAGVAAWNEQALAVEAPVLLIANAQPHWLAFLKQPRPMPTSQLRIPAMAAATRSNLDGLVLSVSNLARQRSELEAAVLQRLLADFAPPGVGPGERLQEWWKLDFEELRTEVINALRNDIPARFRDTWRQIHAEQSTLHQEVSTRITDLEATIAAQVRAVWQTEGGSEEPGN